MHFFKQKRPAWLFQALGAFAIFLVSIGLLRQTQDLLHEEIHADIENYLAHYSSAYYFNQMKQLAPTLPTTSIPTQMPSKVTRLFELNTWNTIGAIDIAGIQSLLPHSMNIEIMPQLNQTGRNTELTLHYRWKTANTFVTKTLKTIKATGNPTLLTQKPLLALNAIQRPIL